MVKGYDATNSDPTKWLLDRLFSFFDPYKVTITPEGAAAYIKQWLQSQTFTSEVYKKFNQQRIKPKIILYKKCPKPLLLDEPYQGDTYFGGYQKQQQLHICLNNIRNKIELKQNVDRQLNFMYNLTKNEDRNQTDERQKDKRLIINLYESCKQGYRNYGWENSTLDRASKKCATYLFRRRVESQLPPDSLFRYAAKVADQYCL